MICKDSPHPAHRGFAEAIDADILSFTGNSSFGGTVLEDIRHGLRMAPTDYDVYLAEGSSDLYLLAQLAIRTDAHLIYLCADHRLYGLSAYQFTEHSLKGVIKKADRTLDLAILSRICRRYINGVIAGSTLVTEFISPVFEADIPMAVANPYIQSNVYEDLKGIDPSLDNNVAVTIGASRDHKGFDRLARAWPTVRDTIPDAELYIVGAGQNNKYSDVPGVITSGYIEQAELYNILESASLYVHPARIEAFGVTTVEAMLAGLPAIVTNTTGSRTAVERLNPNFVTPPSMEQFCAAVTEYFKLSNPLRRDHSIRARAIGSKFDVESKQASFADSFESVLVRLG